MQSGTEYASLEEISRKVFAAVSARNLCTRRHAPSEEVSGTQELSCGAQAPCHACHACNLGPIEVISERALASLDRHKRRTQLRLVCRWTENEGGQERALQASKDDRREERHERVKIKLRLRR